jgi:hypothetical protein
MTFADATTGGFIAGNIVTALLLLLVIAVAAWAGFGCNYDAYSVLGRRRSVALILCCIPLIIAAYVWSTWPFAYEYHHWVDKKVTVAAMSSRLLTDGDGNINQKFVVRDAGGTYYGVNDTRGALAKEGDTLTLRCKKSYDFGTAREAQGWDCKWNGRNP